jgi:hypothetical protein
VQVIDHDHAVRHVGGVERVDEFGDHRPQRPALRRFVAVARQRGGDQRVGRGAPGQVERFECRDQAAEELQRRVALVAADPGDGRTFRQLIDGLRQRRRFAEAGRRADQHQRRRAERVHESLLQGRTSQQRAGPRARRLDLGAGEVQQGLARRAGRQG